MGRQTEHKDRAHAENEWSGGEKGERSLNTVVEAMGSGGRALELKSQPCHSLAVCLKQATDIA